MGNNCLEVASVIGCRRVPLPPAKIIPFIPTPFEVRLILFADARPVANATAFGGYINSQSYRARGAELAFEAAVRRELRVMASWMKSPML